MSETARLARAEVNVLENVVQTLLLLLSIGLIFGRLFVIRSAKCLCRVIYSISKWAGVAQSV